MNRLGQRLFRPSGRLLGFPHGPNLPPMVPLPTTSPTYLHHVSLAVITEVGCANHIHLTPFLRDQFCDSTWQAGLLLSLFHFHLQKDLKSLHISCKQGKKDDLCSAGIPPTHICVCKGIKVCLGSRASQCKARDPFPWPPARVVSKFTLGLL